VLTQGACCGKFELVVAWQRCERRRLAIRPAGLTRRADGLVTAEQLPRVKGQLATYGAEEVAVACFGENRSRESAGATLVCDTEYASMLRLQGILPQLVGEQGCFGVGGVGHDDEALRGRGAS
jgi:hypothetical protein